MLLRFCVEGYRSFSNRLVFDLSKTRDYRFNSAAILDGVVKDALVYGRNGSGKTNLGMAIMDGRYNVALDTLGHRENGIFLNADKDCSSARFSYLLSLEGHEVLYEYSKGAKGVLNSERLEVDEETVFSIDENGDMPIDNLADFTSGSLVVKNEEIFLGLSFLSYMCTNTPRSLLGPVFALYQFLGAMQFNGASSLSDDIASVIDADKVKDLETFLRNFGIGESLVVQPDASGVQVLHMRKRERVIPFADACSSGTQTLVRLFAIRELGKSRPSLLFLDEFDACYHHDLAESVLASMLADDGMQVIATTHNTDLFSNKTLRPDCLFVLSESGIVAAADATDRELREGHNLERLYKAGEFDV